MLSCWRTIPESRPLFNELELHILHMMDRSIGKHYIELNESYLKESLKSPRPASNQTDYFALLGCPDFPSPSIPKSILEILPESEAQPDDDKSSDVINSGFYVYNSIYYGFDLWPNICTLNK